MLDYFDKVFVINLKRRTDRLTQFQAELKKSNWPFKEPVIVPAIDGRLCPIPKNWKGGQGAWGCARSHLHIFEQVFTDKLKAVLILEDDAFFVPDFAIKTANFLKAIPDWDALFLGGQHLLPPTPFKSGIHRCRNTNRTHAYAMKNGKFMKSVYEAWLTHDSHIDHKLGPMCREANVFSPDPFLVGQDESKSDIMNSHLHKRLWAAAPEGSPVILLKTTKKIKEQLADHLHFGYNMKNGIDVGLIDAFNRPDPTARLRAWIKEVGGEAWIVGKKLAIWHPKATEDHVRKAHGPVVIIEAATVEEALKRIPQMVDHPVEVPRLEPVLSVEQQARRMQRAKFV